MPLKKKQNEDPSENSHSENAPPDESLLFADTPALVRTNETSAPDEEEQLPPHPCADMSQDERLLFPHEEAQAVHSEEGRSPYIVLARRYRPQTFDDIVGQEHVREALRQAIVSGQIAHAYLFSGPRGTGKTSTARILAKAVNCQTKGPRPDPCGHCASCRAITSGNSLDVIEIDAASNTGVDNIRELRTGIVLAPFSRYKVYIVDEVHMLSMQAFNALLKTLEEPPPRVIFVLATTELHKVPQTIISRCQCFQFRRFTSREIVSHLDKILTKEAAERRIHVEPQEKLRILELIAQAAEGCMRDAQVALDQILVLCRDRLDYETVRQFFGGIQSSQLERFVRSILERRVDDLLQLVNEVVANGLDLERFVKNVAEYLRDLLLLRQTGKESNLVDAPEDRLDVMQELANAFSLSRLVNLCHAFVRLADATKTTGNVRFLLELEIIRLACLDPEDDLTKLIEALKDLDLARIGTGSGVQAQTSVSPVQPLQTLADKRSTKTAMPPSTVSPQASSSVSAVEKVASGGSAVASENCIDLAHPKDRSEVKATLQISEANVEHSRADGLLPQALIEELVAEISGKHKTLGRVLPKVQAWRIQESQLLLYVNPADRFLCDTLRRETNRAIIAEKLREKIGKNCIIRVQFVGAEENFRDPVTASHQVPLVSSALASSTSSPPADDLASLVDVSSEPTSGFDQPDNAGVAFSEDADESDVEQDNTLDVDPQETSPSVDRLHKKITRVLKGAELKKYLQMHPDVAFVVEELNKVLGTNETSFTLRLKPTEE